MNMLKYVLLVIFAFTESHGAILIDTSNISWTVANEDGGIQAPAKVPGGVYESLMDAGVLDQGDFYYRYNDINYRYISYQNWTYTTNFEVAEEFQSLTKISMEFEGLDTMSSLTVDGQYIGSSTNMFVHYSFDVTSLIKAQAQHSIEIRFSSPTQWSSNEYETQSNNDYPILPECVPVEYQGECHVNHIRKMQASYSWDWGPAFPDLGIWKPWHIIGWNSARIKNVLFWADPIQTDPEERPIYADWNANLKIIFDLVATNTLISGTITIKLQGETKLEKRLEFDNLETEVTTTESFIVDKDEVDLWWPNGYGSQALYDLEVSWSSDEGESDAKQVKVGFRKIELDQSFVDSSNTDLGRYFRVKVNNEDLFLKGSNWVPAHVLPSKVTDEHVQLLEDAVLSHQNCIRVWGGGVYESNDFYETADRLGILIWQDFMFACNMYPAFDWFLESVSEEVQSQVRRLQFHPSVVLWSGNNENEVALIQNWYGTDANFSLYKEDYLRLYVDELMVTILQEDESREVLSSSPSNGIRTVEEGYIADNPQDGRYGDVHHFTYEGDAWIPEIYPMTRFASEYGFQSWLSFRTFSEVLSEEDWSTQSDMMNHRQHHPIGQSALANQISDHFNFNLDNNSTSAFKHYLYLTQVHQAMAIKTESEYYLRQRIEMDENGAGLTSGALYWQLNDIWQGASWSSIEYGGRWKLLHNFAVRFFDPLLISPVIHDGKIDVYIMNDRLDPMSDLTLQTCLKSYQDMEPLLCLPLEISNLDRLSATVVATYDLTQDLQLEELCDFPSYSPEDSCFLLFSLTDDVGETVTWESFLLLGEPKDAPLNMAIVEIADITQISPSECEIELTSSEVAMFVWLETDFEGYFIDNGFIMSDIAKTVTFHGRHDLSCSALQESIEITTLTDTYEML